MASRRRWRRFGLDAAESSPRSRRSTRFPPPPPTTPPAHGGLNVDALVTALFVGVIAGLASGALTNLVYGCEDLFEKLPIHWMWWPVIGALFVGLGGWMDPRVLGVGYDVIHQLLRGEL